ncbi:MAG: hypothetical protein U0270_43600 [Labilithrix sp.]
MTRRIFLISPARLDGVRAKSIFEPAGKGGKIAQGVRTREGLPIGEVFQMLSGLYFRGKLAYAKRFARPCAPWVGSGALVITANRGLVPAETRVTLEHLEAFAETDIHHAERNFRAPLERDAKMLLEALGDEGEVVLLGSVANAKYTAPLLGVFDDRLLFPSDFVGRGDMSRGGLLLRAVEAGTELAYAKVKGASLHGARPAKLTPRRPRGGDR